MIDSWVENLYKVTFEQWRKYDSNPSGYAIFYSPVVPKPDIMILGYNPGGASDSFNANEVKVPSEHDYIKGDYKLAQKMKIVFEELKPEISLENTLKLNLIFFRSKRASDFVNKELINFCKEKVEEIIQKIEPKVIIAEGFKTFDTLLEIMKGKESQRDFEENNQKRIVRLGEISKHIRVIGLIHPSGARGVSNERLKIMGKFIRQHLKAEI